MNFKVVTAADKDTVREYLDKMPEGKRYDVSIVLHREKRTVDQNRLMWLWLACISAETGTDKDDLHRFFKQKYLGFDTKTIMGKKVYEERSTTALDTAQFKQYLDRIQIFANAELGIILPNPEDRMFENFFETYKNYI